ncbi:MAG TPA: hypothetical protein DHW07_04980 [Gammaproteobacteria bacterium]|nr:hypothetical protein [Gammaproteobacteria bacterium]
MELETETARGRTTISSYAPDGVVIGAEKFTESFILMPDGNPERWAVDRFSDLSTSILDALCAVDCEVLLIGTGTNQQFPDSGHTRVLVERNRSAEFMSSRSACSTFNVLSLDDRSVTAAIILPL